MKLFAAGPILLTALIALVPAVSPGSTPATTTVPDWAGDIAYLRRELPARHPNLFFQTERTVFDAGLDALAQAAPQLEFAEVGLRLQELLVRMGDDHTSATLQPGEAGSPLPLNLYWFSDGWRILGVDREQRTVLGQKLTAIGGVPMGEVEAHLTRLLSAHSPVVKSRLPGLVVLPAVLRHCGLAAADGVTLTTRDDNGADREIHLSFAPQTAAKPSNLARFEPDTMPYGFQNQRAIMWSRLMPKSRIYYLQYNRCEGREVAERLGATPEAAAKLPSLEAGLDDAFAQLQAALAKGEADRFILDLRFNPGGASDFGTRFAEKVARLPGLQEPGRVFVIIGRRTFSSAIINAGDFQRLTHAVLVGEPASGTPNHYGQTANFTLPSSGLIVTCSTKYFGQPGAPLEPLLPDVPAEMSFDQFRRGSDPALTAILNHIKKQSAAPASPAGR